MKKTAPIAILLLCLLLLTACGSSRGNGRVTTITPSASVPVVPLSTPTPTPSFLLTPTPAPSPTPTPFQTPTPTPTPTPVPIPTPTPTPTPIPTVVPTPVPTSPLPIITKSPTDETVDEGGSCWFIAKYENATIAVWHFVSPDRQTDLTYEAAQRQFPTMEILNGMYSNLQLKNIPYAANGWRVYCRYSNNNGSTDTNMALITVRENPNPTPFTPSTPQVTTVIVQNYTGSWQDEISQRCSMEITQDASGAYLISVHWGNSAFSTSLWTMTARDDGTGKLVYYDCSSTVVNYTQDGSSSTVVSNYNGGSGSLYFNEAGKLVWQSNMGDIPQNAFSRTPY